MNTTTTTVSDHLKNLAKKRYRSGTVIESDEYNVRLSDTGDIIYTPISMYLHIENNNRCYIFSCNTMWKDIVKNVDKKKEPKCIYCLNEVDTYKQYVYTCKICFSSICGECSEKSIIISPIKTECTVCKVEDKTSELGSFFIMSPPSIELGVTLTYDDNIEQDLFNIKVIHDNPVLNDETKLIHHLLESCKSKEHLYKISLSVTVNNNFSVDKLNSYEGIYTAIETRYGKYCFDPKVRTYEKKIMEGTVIASKTKTRY